MPSNLRWKWLSIAATVLVCILAIVGLPKSTADLRDRLSRSIRLGLDLKGGSHMVLQVQVQDAFKAEADQLIDQLKPALDRAQIGYGPLERNDPDSIQAADLIEVRVRNVPSARDSDFLQTAKESAGDRWVVERLAPGDYRFRMSPQAAVALRQETLAQTISTTAAW